MPPKQAPPANPLADLLAAGPPMRGSECETSIIARKLPPDVLATLDVVMSDAQITAEAIAKKLRGMGYRVSPKSLNRHRRGGCMCDERPNAWQGGRRS